MNRMIRARTIIPRKNVIGPMILDDRYPTDVYEYSPGVHGHCPTENMVRRVQNDGGCPSGAYEFLPSVQGHRPTENGVTSVLPDDKYLRLVCLCSSPLY
jgi:hypothetical protein